MNCPKCGMPAWRDSVDVGVGVGIMYGPYGCPCGWSESPEYDLGETGPRLTPEGYEVDQWGGLTPRRFAEDVPDAG